MPLYGAELRLSISADSYEAALRLAEQAADRMNSTLRREILLTDGGRSVLADATVEAVAERRPEWPTQ